MLQEHISLYMVSSCGRYVVFTVTEPSRDVYCSDEAPFLYITQFRLVPLCIIITMHFHLPVFRLASHLVLMDMETFNILAQVSCDWLSILLNTILTSHWPAVPADGRHQPGDRGQHWPQRLHPPGADV